MSPPVNLDSVRAFLDTPYRAVLATLGATGGPHVVVVDYLVLDDGLCSTGDATDAGWPTSAGILARRRWSTTLTP